MKSILCGATFGVMWFFAAAVLGSGPLTAMTKPQANGGEVVALHGSNAFECVLPYVSRGGIVNIVSASEMDQTVEITVMDAYQYSIVAPRNSSYSFEAPTFKGVFEPIVDGGPISFKSKEPIAVSTVLTNNALTVRCSELNQRTKLFVGSAKVRLALVNTTKSPMRVQFFQDAEQTPISTVAMTAHERKLVLLEELFPVSGTHAYRVVADRDGFGFAVIGREKGAG